MNPTATLGWLGAGRMGRVMIERLVAGGIPLLAWNRTASKLDGLDSSVQVAQRASDVAACPVVFSIVLDDVALDALATGPDGLFAQSATGPAPAIWVDCSTVSPEASMRAADAAAGHGTQFVAASVSGNPGVVAAGNASYAISGPADAVATASEYLNVIGGTVVNVGDAHQARVVKLCTNAMLAVLAQTLSEVLVIGQEHGLRRGVLLDFLNSSVVGSAFTSYKRPAYVDLDMTPTFAPEGLAKDVRMALELSADRPPVLGATGQALADLIDSGLGVDKDFAALLLLRAQQAGIDLRPEGD